MSVEQLHATRRLLPHAAAAAAAAAPSVAAGPPQVQVPAAAHSHAAAAPFSSLNATVITVLSLLLCGLVVVLAVHAVVRCAFRVTRRVCYGHDEEPPGVVGGGSAAAAAASACQAGSRRKRGPRTGLPPWILYSGEVELAGCGAAECAICLTEFAQGDRVRALPRCNHGFHVRCIDRWLAARQTCPTCRRAPFAAAKPSPSLPAGRDGAEMPAPEATQLQVDVEAGAGAQPETTQ